jgi:starvation-inducible DNA-binding protein
MSSPLFTVPGMDAKEAGKVCDLLQRRLVSLIDLQLTLKHIHWNVVGPTFIGVHEMLDPQVEGVQEMVDDTAERIATLGGSPNGLPGNLVEARSWDDYSLGRATVQEHLGALDQAYSGVVADHRTAIDTVEDLDKVTQDVLIAQSERLERYHWFVRAHLESAGGRLSTEGSTGERDAAKKASSRRRAS